MTDAEKIFSAGSKLAENFYNDPIYMFKSGVQYRDNNPSPEVKALIQTVEGSIEYLESCGYDKIEECEPDFQMLQCLRLRIANYRKSLKPSQPTETEQKRESE